MSILLGNPTYSSIKDYAEIQGDMSAVNSTVFITEGKVIKTDSGYAFCMIAKGISDMYKSDTFKPDTQVCFIAHTKEYTRWTKDNPKLPTQPTPLELTLIEYLQSDGATWLEKSFKGRLHLIGSEGTCNLIRESKKWNVLCEFEECEPSLIKEGSLLTGSKGRGSSSSQTEAQRLADRQAYLIAQMGDYGKDVSDLLGASLALAQMEKDMPGSYKIFTSWVALVMSNR